VDLGDQVANANSENIAVADVAQPGFELVANELQIGFDRTYKTEDQLREDTRPDRLRWSVRFARGEIVAIFS
jgi:hypothetical protein